MVAGALAAARTAGSMERGRCVSAGCPAALPRERDPGRLQEAMSAQPASSAGGPGCPAREGAETAAGAFSGAA